MRYTIALIVAFVGLSIAADGSASRHISAGTVVGWEPGKSITIARDQTDPWGHEIYLRSNTVYEGDAIRSGVFVQVWYRSVGERRGVADRVLVINAVAR